MNSSEGNERFAFGRNWQRFRVDAVRIEDATRGVAKLAGDLHGRSFLDVGSGSGLMSLAAVRLGATRVKSFDVDADSVACTEALRRKEAPDVAWSVSVGSALDEAFLESLGEWDVVYAWGVLHHTGEMWRAIDRIAKRVHPGGTFVLAVYNHARGHLGTFDSKTWHAIKRAYVRGNGLEQRAMLVMYVAWRMSIALSKGRHPLSEMRERKARGMDFFVDARDWLGGFPYEYASPDEVSDFVANRGFTLTHIERVHPDGWGCNELVFTRDNVLHPTRQNPR